MTTPDPGFDLAQARALAGLGNPLFQSLPRGDGTFSHPTAWPEIAGGAAAHEAIDTLQPGWALCAPMGHTFTALDLDLHKPGMSAKELRAMLDACGVAPCGVAQTPSGGLHVLVPRLDDALGNFVGLHGNLDIRTRGGFIYIAPTPKPAGAYRWMRPVVAPESREGVDLLSEALLSAYREKQAGVERRVGVRRTSGRGPGVQAMWAEARRHDPDAFFEWAGGRNVALHKMVASLCSVPSDHDFGFKFSTEAEILDEMRRIGFLDALEGRMDASFRQDEADYVVWSNFRRYRGTSTVPVPASAPDGVAQAVREAEDARRAEAEAEAEAEADDAPHDPLAEFVRVKDQAVHAALDALGFPAANEVVLPSLSDCRYALDYRGPAPKPIDWLSHPVLRQVYYAAMDVRERPESVLLSTIVQYGSEIPADVEGESSFDGRTVSLNLNVTTVGESSEGKGELFRSVRRWFSFPAEAKYLNNPTPQGIYREFSKEVAGAAVQQNGSTITAGPPQYELDNGCVRVQEGRFFSENLSMALAPLYYGEFEGRSLGTGDGGYHRDPAAKLRCMAVVDVQPGNLASILSQSGEGLPQRMTWVRSDTGGLWDRVIPGEVRLERSQLPLPDPRRLPKILAAHPDLLHDLELVKFFKGRDVIHGARHVAINALKLQQILLAILGPDSMELAKDIALSLNDESVRVLAECVKGAEESRWIEAADSKAQEGAGVRAAEESVAKFLSSGPKTRTEFKNRYGYKNRAAMNDALRRLIARGVVAERKEGRRTTLILVKSAQAATEGGEG